MTGEISGLSRVRIIRSVVKDVWESMWRDDVPFYAAGIAYHSLFSIFSLMFLMSLLMGLLGRDPDTLRGLAAFAAGLVPEKATELVETILQIVRKPVPHALLPVAIMVTLWTSSNVVQAVIHALHRIYHLEQRSRAAWRTRLMALGVVGASTLLLILAFVLLVFGTDLSARMGEMETIRIQILAWILAAREPLSILAVFGGVLLLYWLAPEFGLTHRVSWPGAMAFTLAWTVTTLGFNVYLRELAVYDKVYGPMATVVVVLVWVYLSAFLCLVGGEINAAIHRLRSRSHPVRS